MGHSVPRADAAVPQVRMQGVPAQFPLVQLLRDRGSTAAGHVTDSQVRLEAQSLLGHESIGDTTSHLS